ncbi:MAG: hypothetical protein KF773_03695 [Deltaproteobacteria bacterium]|nr:hypothetical protein [Deltaproteobacteria bacterium]
MRFLLLVVLVGCGSAATVVGNAAPKPDVRTSRDAMVREVVALLAAGDANALLALADAEALGPGCHHRSRKRHERIALAAGRARGSVIEVVRIDPVAGGNPRERECAQLGVIFERMRVQVRIGGVLSTAAIGLVWFDGRYYLVDVPQRLGGPETAETTEKFLAYVDVVCACRDTACISDTEEAYRRETEVRMRSGAPWRTDPPTDEETDLLDDVTQRLADCTARIAPPQTVTQ